MLAKGPPKPTIRDFRGNLRALEREVAIQLEGETTCCGVTLAQCHCLLELSQRECSLTALADALDLDKSTLSRTIESMVQSGLCERSTVAGDRRSVRLTLSSIGRSKVDKINRICDEYYGNVLSHLSDSVQRQVIRSVGILADAMKQQRKSGETQPSCCGEEKEARDCPERSTVQPRKPTNRSRKKAAIRRPAKANPRREASGEPHEGRCLHTTKDR